IATLSGGHAWSRGNFRIPAGQICTGPARHQPRTSAEVQRENERDVGIAEAVAGEIGRYAKSGVGSRPALCEHYATPGHQSGELRNWRPFSGGSEERRVG